MGPAPRHGHGRVLYQLRVEAAQLRIKAMNARAVELAGIETHQILLMENTNSPRRAKRQAPSVRHYVTLTQDVVGCDKASFYALFCIF